MSTEGQPAHTGIPNVAAPDITDAVRQLAADPVAASRLSTDTQLAAALVLLGFAHFDAAKPTLTSTGRALASAGKKQDQEIFAAAAVTVPLVRRVMTNIQRLGRWTGVSVDRLRVIESFDGIEDHQVDLAIAWGTYGHLLRRKGTRIHLTRGHAHPWRDPDAEADR